MRIATPTRSGEPLLKTVQVGGGIMTNIPGIRMLTLVEVMQIDEAAGRVRVKHDTLVWVEQAQIKDAVDPSTYAVQAAINRDDMKEEE